MTRVTINEFKRQQKDIELRHGSQARKEQYSEAAARALVTHGEPDNFCSGRAMEEETVFRYGPKQRYRAAIRHDPFSIDFLRNDELHHNLNGQGLMNVKHCRAKVVKIETVEASRRIPRMVKTRALGGRKPLVEILTLSPEDQKALEWTLAP